MTLPCPSEALAEEENLFGGSRDNLLLILIKTKAALGFRFGGGVSLRFVLVSDLLPSRYGVVEHVQGDYDRDSKSHGALHVAFAVLRDSDCPDYSREDGVACRPQEAEETGKLMSLFRHRILHV